jgi:hypothetical protein
VAFGFRSLLHQPYLFFSETIAFNEITGSGYNSFALYKRIKHGSDLLMRRSFTYESIFPSLKQTGFLQI